jgi:hypothetical protein
MDQKKTVRIVDERGTSFRSEKSVGRYKKELPVKKTKKDAKNVASSHVVQQHKSH